MLYGKEWLFSASLPLIAGVGIRVCVCVCEREREGKRERQRERERERERERAVKNPLFSLLVVRYVALYPGLFHMKLFHSST